MKWLQRMLSSLRLVTLEAYSTRGTVKIAKKEICDVKSQDDAFGYDTYSK